MPRLRLIPFALVLLLAPIGITAQAPLVPQPDITGQINALSDQPPTHTGFVFDRSMLMAAQAVLEADGMDQKSAAVALTSISYDHYLYAQPAEYSPDAIAAIASAYHAAGWKHLVNAHGTVSAATDGKPHPITDLWLHTTGAKIDGLTVLTRGVRNVNLIQVACDLRPLDLVHLGGHFGIPKVDPSAVMVPAPDNR